MTHRRVQFNAVQTLAFSFAALILSGGELLSMPIASRSGQGVPCLDGLFTDDSASSRGWCCTTPGASSPCWARR